MSVSDGQSVNAAVTNNAFVSRLVDTSTVGVLDLLDPTSAISGPTVLNTQKHINDLIQDHKAFVYLANEGEITWSGSSLSFAEDIVIRFEDTGFTNTILAANSPIALADGENIYVTLDRSMSANVTPVILSSVPTGKDIFRFATRVDTLIIFFDNSVLTAGSSAIIGEGSGGSGSGSVIVDLYDPSSTTLPAGPTAIIDGVSVSNGDWVLFSNLSSGNNQIYEVSGVGVSLVWTLLTEFTDGATPIDGESVRVTQGNGFAEQLALFDGSTFLVNDKIRLFTGVDYVEINSIQTSTLLDNTTGSVFELAYLGSENIAVFYSITRSTDKESGFIQVTTDGTTVNVSSLQNVLSACGVTFLGDISGADLRLRYTTTSTGDDATMRYFITRWSDAAGGPGGPPSYLTGSFPVQAAGSSTEIQYNTSGILDSSPDFTWDDSSKVLEISGSAGSVETVGLVSATLTDNVAVATTIFSFAHASYKYLVLDCSVTRSTNAYLPTLKVLTDGTNASVAYDGPSIGSVGITFSAQVSGANCLVQYVSTSTGFNATMKYTIRRWI